MNGNSGSKGCVRGGREEYAIIFSFLYIYGFFVAIEACIHLVGVISRYICREWNLAFLIFYDCFFVPALACFHLVGVMCALSV